MCRLVRLELDLKITIAYKELLHLLFCKCIHARTATHLGTCAQEQSHAEVHTHAEAHARARKGSAAHVTMCARTC